MAATFSEALIKFGCSSDCPPASQGLQWQIYPRVDTLVCNCSEMDSGKGPTRHLLTANESHHLGLVRTPPTCCRGLSFQSMNKT